MGVNALLATLKPSNSVKLTDAELKYILVGLIIALWYWLSCKDKSSYDLPPSPPSGLFSPLGHERIVFSRLPSRKYTELAKDLGNIIYLSVFGRPIIVINSVEDARELLDKRGALYSERPPTPLMGELYGWKNTLGLLPYGERFRLQRRMMQQTFNSQAVKCFRESQKKRIAGLLKNLLDDDQSWLDSIRLYVSANIMKATYGHEIKSDEDKFVKLAVAAAKALTANPTGGTDITDILPFLCRVPSWFPGCGFKKNAAMGKKLQHDLQELPYADIKSLMGSTNLEHGMLPRLLEEYEMSGANDPSRELDIKNIAAVTYGASLNTSGISLTTFLLMMILHPEAAKAAQEEIDRVVGSNRLPDLEDRANLPLVDCIMKEAWRMHPPTPLGLAHGSAEEDTYMGMRIPAKSIMIPNMWRMMRDPKHFDRPEEFRPQRFLEKVKSYENSEQALNGLYPDDPSSIVFGFGRRTCPGRYFADAMVWLVMACTLTTFDFRTYVDPVTGVEEIPKLECLPGQTSAIQPFKYRLVPRSEERVRLVRELAADS